MSDHRAHLDPPNLVRVDAADQIFFHIVVPGGNVDGEQARATCPARSCRNRRRSRARARPAASRCRAAPTPAPSAPARASSPARRRRSDPARSRGCRCRWRRCTPDVVELLDRRRAGAGVAVAARAGDERRAARRQPRRDRPCVICTPWTASTRSSRNPLSSRYCTGVPPAAPRPDPRRRAPRAARATAAAAADELDFLRPTPTGARCTARTDRDRRPRGSRGSTSGATEYGACAARLARTRSVGAERVDLAQRVARRAPSGSAALKPNQLVEHDRRRAGCAPAARR